MKIINKASHVDTFLGCNGISILSRYLWLYPNAPPTAEMVLNILYIITRRHSGNSIPFNTATNRATNRHFLTY